MACHLRRSCDVGIGMSCYGHASEMRAYCRSHLSQARALRSLPELPTRRYVPTVCAHLRGAHCLSKSAHVTAMLQVAGRGVCKTAALLLSERFHGVIILKAEIHLAIAIGIAIAIDPSWDGRLIPIAIPKEYEPSALCATCCAANGCISTCRQFTPRLGAGRPRPERTAEDRRLHKRLQSTTLHHSKLGPQNGLHRRKLQRSTGRGQCSLLLCW